MTASTWIHYAMQMKVMSQEMSHYTVSSCKRIFNSYMRKAIMIASNMNSHFSC